MSEKDLAKVVIEYFSDELNDVYQEVPCMGIVDIVVKSPKVVMAIECKLQFSFAVIEQAFRNQYHFNYSYVAVPKLGGSFQEKVCRDYGIGVLAVRNGQVMETVRPRLVRRPCTVKLHDYMKRSVAGSQNERMTSFKFFLEDLEIQLRRAGSAGMDHKQIFNETYRHYNKPIYVKNNLVSYIRTGVVKNVRFDQGRFYLLSA